MVSAVIRDRKDEVLDLIQTAIDTYEECTECNGSPFEDYDFETMMDYVAAKGLDFHAGLSKIVAESDDDSSEVMKVVMRPLYQEEQDESIVYQEAKEAGFADFFAAPTSPIFTHRFFFDGFDVVAIYYFEERVKSYSPSDYYFKKKYNGFHSTKTRMGKLSLYGTNDSYISSAFRTAIHLFLGKRVTEFLEFLEDADLGDFHSGNWAIVNGKLKIFDYSGGYSSGRM